MLLWILPRWYWLGRNKIEVFPELPWNLSKVHGNCYINITLKQCKTFNIYEFFIVLICISSLCIVNSLNFWWFQFECKSDSTSRIYTHISRSNVFSESPLGYRKHFPKNVVILWFQRSKMLRMRVPNMSWTLFDLCSNASS